MDKQPGRRISRSQLGEIRRNVIGALARGVHPEDAADAFGVGRSTVYKWLSDYQADGLDALLAFRKAPGAAPKLNQAQAEKLRRWIVGRDPRQLQFDYALWTREIVRDLIRRELGSCSPGWAFRRSGPWSAPMSRIPSGSGGGRKWITRPSGRRLRGQELRSSSLTRPEYGPITIPGRHGARLAARRLSRAPGTARALTWSPQY